jgi:hypothetical protein
MDLVQLFCDVDDFVKALSSNKNYQISHLKSKRGVTPRMSLSEMMTIIILYHSSGFKNFKSFYFYVRHHLKSEFPSTLSYTRFIDWIPYCLMPLAHFSRFKMGKSTGISFIDSTSIRVCKNIRIPRNNVFKNIASRGKTSMGWFFGFKLHIVVNDKGDLLNFMITKGNTHDVVPVEKLAKTLSGKLFGDKGYCSQKLSQLLFKKNIQLITNVRGNMKNKLLPLIDKILLRKRFIIETINDQLKNISDIEHSRHRSPTNFLTNIIAGLISYIYQPKKPSLKWHNNSITLS